MNNVILINLILVIVIGCGTGNNKTHKRSLSRSVEMNSDSTLITGWYYITTDTTIGYKRHLDKSNKSFYIDPKPIVTRRNFTKLEIYEDRAGGYGLSIRLDENGTQEWAIATEKTIGKNLAFVLNDKLLYLPSVNAKIEFGLTALNRGDLSKEELQNIKNLIERGEL